MKNVKAVSLNYQMLKMTKTRFSVHGGSTMQDQAIAVDIAGLRLGVFLRNAVTPLLTMETSLTGFRLEI